MADASAALPFGSGPRYRFGVARRRDAAADAIADGIQSQDTPTLNTANASSLVGLMTRAVPRDYGRWAGRADGLGRLAGRRFLAGLFECEEDGMSQEDVKTMQDAYDAFNRGDIPAVTETQTSDIEWNEPGGGRAPQGTFSGPESVANNVFSTVPKF
jgi:hypothetical protein